MWQGRLYAREGNVTDSGLEGFTFEFKWELYGGHHHVRQPEKWPVSVQH